jgi:hypothetical protein
MKFWPQDWQRDPALRCCSLAARGLWLELMCLAHDAEPYGHILIAGRQPSISDIAAIAGTTPGEAKALLTELKNAAVFSRTEGGIIFSRRMVKDAAASEKGKNAISKRWVNNFQATENKDNYTKPNTKPKSDPNSLDTESDIEKERIAKAIPKKGRRLPPDWSPSPANRQYAADLGLNADRTADDFRGYWLAKAGAGAVKLDWSLTWQGWCRREADRRGTYPAAKSDSPPPPRFI